MQVETKVEWGYVIWTLDSKTLDSNFLNDSPSCEEPRSLPAPLGWVQPLGPLGSKILPHPPPAGSQNSTSVASCSKSCLPVGAICPEKAELGEKSGAPEAWPLPKLHNRPQGQGPAPLPHTPRVCDMWAGGSRVICQKLIHLITFPQNSTTFCVVDEASHPISSLFFATLLMFMYFLKYQFV